MRRMPVALCQGGGSSFGGGGGPRAGLGSKGSVREGDAWLATRATTHPPPARGRDEGLSEREAGREPRGSADVARLLLLQAHLGSIGSSSESPSTMTSACCCCRERRREAAWGGAGTAEGGGDSVRSMTSGKEAMVRGEPTRRRHSGGRDSRCCSIRARRFRAREFAAPRTHCADLHQAAWPAGLHMRVTECWTS